MAGESAKFDRKAIGDGARQGLPTIDEDACARGYEEQYDEPVHEKLR
ncbi:MAG: hypothetical protein WBE26_02980 [Phycisphaerae bacterium]